MCSKENDEKVDLITKDLKELVKTVKHKSDFQGDKINIEDKISIYITLYQQVTIIKI